MSELYGGYIIFSNNTNERLDKMYFAPGQIGLYNQYTQKDPCGRKIIHKEWFEEPITDRGELELITIKAAQKLKQPIIIQTQ